jgi:hypothetical protein
LRETCDDVQQWIDAGVVTDRNARVSSSVAYDDYRTWVTAHTDSKPKDQKTWSQEMTAKGFQKTKNGAGRMVWSGVRLRNDGVQPEHRHDASGHDGNVGSVFTTSVQRVLTGGGRLI